MYSGHDAVKVQNKFNELRKLELSFFLLKEKQVLIMCPRSDYLKGVGHSLSDAGHSLSDTGHSLSDAGHSLSEAGHGPLCSRT